MEPLKGIDEKAQAIVERTADTVKVTVEEMHDFTRAIEKRVGEIGTGEMETATEFGGGLFMTIKSTVSGIVKADSGGGTCGQNCCCSH
jgi:hypothetical protein